ncbi:hypothetical protein F5148DRAFT_493418 [Russula earlei]|uniref:Uncharacterized protein n=1 Tax=Russula earlei TaxID=71964 RepID=A0ACC0TXU0_9AGAM|nr:hypothetical protein F5148DRAFT_493418 [Russula earlei]
MKREGGQGKRYCTKAGAAWSLTRGRAERPADGAAAAARTRRTDKGGCEESSNVSAGLPKGGRDGAKEWGSRTATRRGEGDLVGRNAFGRERGKRGGLQGIGARDREFRSRGASCSWSGAMFIQLAAPPVHSERGASWQSRRTRYNEDSG